MGVDIVKVVNISKKRFNSLEPLSLSREIISTEAVLYHFDDKDRWNRESKLLKKLYVNEGEVFGNKLETVNNLIFYGKVLKNERFVLPEHLVSVGQKIEGFTLPYIEGENLSLVMHAKKTTIKDKINYLKQVGEALIYLQRVRAYSELKDIYIGDLHEQNIIVDKEGQINIIDLDSCKISGNSPFPSRYLVSNKGLQDMPAKYPMDQHLFIPSEDTDLFAYNMMILNAISGGYTSGLSTEEFYVYLNYLDDLKVNHKILESFSDLYCYRPNSNPHEYLDELEKLDARAHYPVFKHRYQKAKVL